MPDRPPRRAAFGSQLGLLVTVVVLAALVGVPLYELFAAALAQGWEPVAHAFAAVGAVEAAWNTLWTAVAVTVLATTIGAAAAVVTERTAAPGRRWLRVGMLVPLVVPPFVAALSWAQAYGPAGLVDELFGVAVPGTYGAAGVVVVIAVNAVPLAYVIVAAALASRAEPDLERAARASGATAWEALRTVTIPLLRPAFVAAAALVFVTAVNAFGVPAILGLPAGFETVTTRIYRDLVLSADSAAFTRVLVLSSGLVVVALALVGAADAADLWSRMVTRTGGPAGGGTVGTVTRWPGVVLWAYLGVAAAVPLTALCLVALTRAVGVSPTPGNWTLANFAEAVRGQGLAALGNSVLLAVASATTVVVLGGLLAGVRRRALGTTATLTFALPGSALAVAVLLGYGPWLRDSLALIFIAYLAKFWALGHRTVAGSLDRLSPDLIRAARSSGASPWSALGTVTLPVLRPALAGAWVTVFLFALHELTMSALLYGPGSETLAVVILNLQQLGDVTVTAALAVVLTSATLALGCAVVGLARATPWRRS